MKAASIIDAAERDMNFTLSLSKSPESSPTIIRNIYESFRMLGDALLVYRGIKHDNHIMQIKELVNLPVNAKRPIQILENLRTLRHNINYNGYKPTTAELEDALDISKELFDPLLKEIKKRII